MVKITVIGTGYVGLVSGACLADFGNTVICVDSNSEKIKALRDGVIPIFEPGLDEVVSRNVREGRLSFSGSLAAPVKGSQAVFIAVGTPPREDGSADLSHVEQAAREIGGAVESYTVVVDKSTVPIGTARKVRNWIGEELARRGADIPFDVVSNPEFLREGSAVFDFTHPDRVVIGGESPRAREIMKEVYRSLYLNETPYIETGPETAEMIKYASNAFLAVKITFINEIANLCEKFAADVQDVANAMGRDGRIGAKFLHPGPGYGGSCFPKDTRALAKAGRDGRSPLTLVEAAIAANERQKELMVEKIESGLGASLKGKTIAVLGLAFKSNTDDMRESPAIAICRGLVEKGACLRISDPAAMKEASWRFDSIKDSIYRAGDEYDAVKGAHTLAILTPWNQYRNLDLERIKELLLPPEKPGALPCFFDLRNIYRRKEVEEAGFEYFGIGK
ncbi:MAG: UDP-glucose/GDP-mannose dehydrogenase family protein [Spirochaetaceae bacterium]|jgi:UDPglucose 6-dehydrogenase|nr:UDP-glucose/GDP-mannose dehydrogenase family protein [Spirochaetaceae bacterium]